MTVEDVYAFWVIASVAVLFAVVWHQCERRYMHANIGSVITTAVLLQIIIFLQLGYLDSFFLLALSASAVVSLMVSSIVGLAFENHRKKHESDTFEQ